MTNLCLAIFLEAWFQDTFNKNGLPRCDPARDDNDVRGRFVFVARDVLHAELIRQFGPISIFGGGFA